MERCEHCRDMQHKGHVMFNSDFYLCEECFDKFYTQDMAEKMYDDDLQYYTEWEELENDLS